MLLVFRGVRRVQGLAGWGLSEFGVLGQGLGGWGLRQFGVLGQGLGGLGFTSFGVLGIAARLGVRV